MRLSSVIGDKLHHNIVNVAVEPKEQQTKRPAFGRLICIKQRVQVRVFKFYPSVDRLQLHAELMSELPLHFFPNTFIFLHWKLLPCKENKPRKLKSSSVFRLRSLQF